MRSLSFARVAIVVGFLGSFMVAKTVFSQGTYYFNSTCQMGGVGCPNSGVCQTVPPTSTCQNSGGTTQYFTQFRSTAFSVGSCSSWFNTDCQTNPKNVCITDYFWDTPDCDDFSFPSYVCHAATPGFDCTTFPH